MKKCALFVLSLVLAVAGVFRAGAAETDANWQSGFGFNGCRYWIDTLFYKNGILYAGGSFTGAGNITSRNIAKWNGQTWEAMGSGLGKSLDVDTLNNEHVYAVAQGVDGTIYAGGSFTVLGDESAACKFVAKWDGEQWTQVGTAVLPKAVEALAVDSDGSLYAGVGISGNSATGGGIYKYNAATQVWDLVGGGLFHTASGSVSSIVTDGAGGVYVGGVFSSGAAKSGQPGAVAVANVAKWDGAVWTPVGTSAEVVGRVSFLAMNPAKTKLYGASKTAQTFAYGIKKYSVAEWNGANWIPMGTYEDPQRPGTAGGLTVDGSGLVYVPESSTSGTDPYSTANSAFLRKWDGVAWTTCGGAEFGGAYCSFGSDLSMSACVDEEGNVYFGGRLTDISNKDAEGQRYILKVDYVAKWDALDGRFACLGDGGIGGAGTDVVGADTHGNVFVGGKFEHIGNTRAQGIATWTGSRWKSMGQGLSGGNAVNSLLGEPGGGVYVGSNMLVEGVTNARNIAFWNGESWNAMSQTKYPKGKVVASAMDRFGTLYIAQASLVTMSDNSTPGSILRWNPATGQWVGIESGTGSAPGNIAGYASGMTCDAEGNLYVATNLANGLRKYTKATSAWSTLGASGNVVSANNLKSIAFDGYESLYCIGTFNIGTVGTPVYTEFATYNLRTGVWSGFSAPAEYPIFPSSINQVVADRYGNAYVACSSDREKGESFSNRRYLAKFDGSKFVDVGSGLEGGWATSVALDSNGSLVVGGAFRSAGGKPALRFAVCDLSPSVRIDPWNGQTSANPIVFTVKWSEDVVGFVQEDLSVTNGTIASFSGSGRTYSVGVTPSGAGVVSLGVGVNAAKDMTGNFNYDTATASITYNPAYLEPPVATITPNDTVVSGSGIVFQIGWSQTVTGFDASDITASNGTVGALTGSGSSYSVSVTPSAAGNVSISIPANSVTGASGGGNVLSSGLVRWDNTPPAAPVIEFPVASGVTTLLRPVFSGTAPSNAVVRVYEGSTVLASTQADGAGNWSVVATSDLGQGAHTIKAEAEDASGLVSAFSGTVNFTVNPSADTVAPVASFSPDAVAVSVSPIVFTLSFSESVTGCLQGNIVATNGSVSSFSGSGSSYTVQVTPSISGGVVGVSVPAGFGKDASNNDSLPASAAVEYAPMANPVATITPKDVVTNESPVVVSFVFSEAVSGFDASDVTVVNGVKGVLSGSGSTYSMPVTPSADGIVSVSVPAGSVVGVTSGKTGGASSATFQSLRTVPTVTFVSFSTTNPSPALSGNTNSPSAVVTASVDGKTYTMTNYGDGTWGVNGGFLDALGVGVHSIVITATEHGNASSIQGTIDVTDPALSQFAVTFVSTEGGSVSGTTQQLVEPGASTSAVTAVASAGYDFVNWTAAGFSSTANPLVLSSVNQGWVITANFVLRGETNALSVVNGAGDGSYGAGTTVQVTAGAAPSGKVFDKWTGDVQFVSDINAAQTFVTMPTYPIVITATYKAGPITSYRVTFDTQAAGATIVGTVSQTILPGGNSTPVTAKAGAGSGQYFVRWGTYDGSEMVPSEVLKNPIRLTNVGGPHSTIEYTAVFQVKLSGYAVNIYGGSGSGQYAQGASVPVVADTVPGYLFSHWTGDTALLANANAASTTLTVSSADASVEAVLVPDSSKQYAVSFATDATVGATISGVSSQTVLEGGNASAVTAVAPTGYRFVNWTGTGGYTSTNNPLTVVNVTGAMSLVANFQPITYTVTFFEGAGGTISGSKTQTVAYGGSTTSVTAVPAGSGSFSHWSGSFSGSANPLVLTNVLGNMTVTANFTSNPTVSFSRSGFAEAAANDGTIDNTVPLEVLLANASFSGSDGENFVASGKVVVSNVPSGLTPVVTRVSATKLEFTLTGVSAGHENDSDVFNLGFALLDSAFSGVTAAAVSGSSRSDLAVDFSFNSLYIVTNLSDAATPPAGSLREAIGLAAAAGGTKRIVFQSGLSGTITVGVSTPITLAPVAGKGLNLTIEGNGAVALSGGTSKAIFAVDAPTDAIALTITDMSFVDGGSSGGAIKTSSAGGKLTLSLSRCSFINNRSSGGGGALYVSGHHDVSITDCAFDANKAVYISTSSVYGGAVYLKGVNEAAKPSTVTIDRCLFKNSSLSSTGTPTTARDASGGALSYLRAGTNDNATVVIKNSTFSGNTATGVNATYHNVAGGAIFTSFSAASTLKLYNCTLAGNSATNTGAGALGKGGAIAAATGGSVTLYNTIVSGNTASDALTNNISLSAATLAGHSSLIHWATGSDGSGIVDGTNGCKVGTGYDPLLAALADNGGLTQTRSLGRGSPARDSGNATYIGGGSYPVLTTDQRGAGFARVSGLGLDMGAFEVQLPADADMEVVRGEELTDGGTDTVSGTMEGSATPLTYTVTNAGTANLSVGSASVSSLVNCSVTAVAQPSSPLGSLQGTSLVLNVTPSAPGAWSFAVSLVTNAPGENPFNWTVEGTAEAIPAPELDISRGGAIADGGTDAVPVSVAGVAMDLTYALNNTGNLGLSISLPVTVSGANNCSASVSSAPAATVASGGATSMVVSVTPAAVGPWSFVVSVANSDANENPYNWTVSGTAGAPEISVERGGAAIASGGNDAVSDTAANSGTVLAYTIVNSGTAVLPVSSATVGSEVNCAVSITAQPAATVATAGNTSLSMTVTPSAVGAWSFAVSLPNGDADETPYTWTVSGTAGVAYDYIVTNTQEDSASPPAGSLRAAIVAAVAAGGNKTIGFQAGLSGTITIPTSTPLTIAPAAGKSLNLTIVGNGAVTLSGGANRQILTVSTASDPVSLTVKNLLFRDGSGAIESSGAGKLTFAAERCSFIANKGSALGGALKFIGQQDTQFVDCVFDGNQINATIIGSTYGGAVYLKGANDVAKPSTVTMDRCLFKANALSSTGTPTAAKDASGGALAYIRAGTNDNATVVIKNSTFSGNSVSAANASYHNAAGGAIYTTFSASSTLKFYNCTLAGNSTTNTGDAGKGKGGAILAETGGSVSLYNTLVSGNTASDGATHNISLSGATLAGYNSLVHWVSGSDGSGLSDGTNGNKVGSGYDPLLAALANNGGLTQTRALGSGSPAVDAGSATYIGGGSYPTLTTDQRGAGFARSIGNSVDIGAFEVQTLPAPEMAVSRSGAVADGGADSIAGTTAGQGTQLAYTVANSGNGALSLTVPVVVSGTSNCAVVVDTQPGASVAAGGQTSLVLTVTPSAAGAWSFAVSIASNDTDENPYNWTVGGTAQAAGQTFEAWVTGKGLSGGGAGVAADADGDGIPNLLEFALNADPAVSDGDRLPTVAVEGSNLVVRYRKGKGLLGVTYTVQSSTDLGGVWTDEGEGSKETDVDAETEVWKVSKPVGTKLFLRLKVRKP